jgi:heavy metal sensor kinase
MTLTQRVSVFFLGTLAVVLAAFSIGLYLLARTYLYRQIDERLASAVHVLVAASEIRADEVEWEPEQHRLSLGDTDDLEQVRWTVQDPKGKFVDRSPNLHNGDFRQVQFPPEDGTAAVNAEWDGQPWRIVRSQVAALNLPDRDKIVRQLASKMARQLKADRPPTRGNSTSTKQPMFFLTCGMSLQPTQATLANLAGALAGLSFGIFLLAAGLGWRLCRRALAPLTHMAQTAGGINADNLDQRLPSRSSNDELDHLAGSFNDLLGRLQESFERQRRFTGDASHQLRTPLTAIIGQLEVALRRDRSPSEYRDVLELVSGQAAHLRQIVEMLLFLSRADAEARLAQLEPLDLTSWLRAQQETWSEHKRGSDLKWTLPEGALVVKSQAALLGQLLHNLLENACKYSPPGTPIWVKLTDEGTQAALSIQDTGLGIAAADLPHIFEPFFRSSEAKRQGIGGIGLGLAIAQRIAIVHDGRIDVGSEVGQGSRFTLRIPKCDPIPLSESGAMHRLGEGQVPADPSMAQPTVTS